MEHKINSSDGFFPRKGIFFFSSETIRLKSYKKLIKQKLNIISKIAIKTPIIKIEAINVFKALSLVLKKYFKSSKKIFITIFYFNELQFWLFDYFFKRKFIVFTLSTLFFAFNFSWILKPFFNKKLKIFLSFFVPLFSK